MSVELPEIWIGLFQILPSSGESIVEVGGVVSVEK